MYITSPTAYTYAYFTIDLNALPIREKMITVKNYYADLKESLDGGYQRVVDKVLWFHYTKLYTEGSQDKLRFRITDMYGNIIVETDQSGNIPSTALVAPVFLPYRENYVYINLTACPDVEENAFYLLTVWNEKNEHYFLRFRYEPMFSMTPIPISID